MACPKCTLRLSRPAKRVRVSLPSRQAFHTSPQHQRLGAFTYAQEWQTGTYHYNKALSRTLPVATNRVDDLLSAYATQQKRRIDPSNPMYSQITKANITAQRRQQDRLLITKSTAKDYGNHMEVTAFVFDGAGAAEAEREAFINKKKGVKASQGAKGGNTRRAPTRRHTDARVASPAGFASPGAGRPPSFSRPPMNSSSGVQRSGNPARPQPDESAGGAAFRRVVLAGRSSSP